MLEQIIPEFLQVTTTPLDTPPCAAIKQVDGIAVYAGETDIGNIIKST